MIEKRKQKRYPVHLKVFSQKADELLGIIEDLSIIGIKILSENPIADKKEIIIWLGASKDGKEEKRIPLTAYKNWDAFTTDAPCLYYSGLHFINPSEKALDMLQEHVDNLSD
jgi:hypothetical protein